MEIEGGDGRRSGCGVRVVMCEKGEKKKRRKYERVVQKSMHNVDEEMGGTCVHCLLCGYLIGVVCW